MIEVDNLSFLKGRKVDLFDKNGGCLDSDNNYISDWWNRSNTYQVKDVWRKYLVLEDETGATSKLPIHLIAGIKYDLNTNSEITLKKMGE